ncbi:uncharacterized protein VTP21DRAFT_9822 [Calcarisporiella thermophila]|uniref:uncharacterized protein n=1 Tax=Calcarisporiella thermophila TaxID=911321 RepID=UPI0037438DD5
MFQGLKCWFSRSVPQTSRDCWAREGGKTLRDPYDERVEFLFSDDKNDPVTQAIYEQGSTTIYRSSWITDSVSEGRLQILGRYVLPSHDLGSYSQGYSTSSHSPVKQKAISQHSHASHSLTHSEFSRQRLAAQSKYAPGVIVEESDEEEEDAVEWRAPSPPGPVINNSSRYNGESSLSHRSRFRNTNYKSSSRILSDSLQFEHEEEVPSSQDANTNSYTQLFPEDIYCESKLEATKDSAVTEMSVELLFMRAASKAERSVEDMGWLLEGIEDYTPNRNGFTLELNPARGNSFITDLSAGSEDKAAARQS